MNQEREIRLFADALPQPVWETNQEGCIIYANEAALLLMGYSQEDLRKGVMLADLIVYDDKEGFMDNFIRHLQGLKSAHYEYLCLRKDGAVFPAIIYISPIYKNDTISGIRGITLDISTQKESEAKLHKNLIQQELLSEIALELNSLENFNNKINKILEKAGIHTNVSRVYIFENSGDGTFTNNTFEWCNTGVTPQMNQLQDVPYELIPSWKKILMEKGRVYSENIRELPQDIREILEPQEIKSIVVYPLHVTDRFFGFIGFDECSRIKQWDRSELELLRTITGMIVNAYERKISEQSLLESEAINRAIIESIPDILFHFDRRGKILNYRSNSIADMAIPPEQFLHKNIKDLFPPTFAIKARRAISICLKKGSYNIEYSLPVNNKIEDYEARLSKMNDNEVIAIIRKVTERKEYERKLKEERDKAKQANIIKTDFLSTMSHEIRTPLNAVVGITNILLMEDPKESQMENLSTLKFSAQNLLNIINDILDYNKLSINRVKLEQIDFNLFELFRGMHFSMNNMAASKQIGLSYTIDDNIPPILVGDSTRLLQIITNLVGNAIKFTKKGAVQLTVDLKEQTSKNVLLHFQVTDTGIGIQPEKIGVIFEEFRQASDNITREFGGTGLGLAIVKKLLHFMGSEICVESEPGKGSRFHFDLSLLIGNEQSSGEIIRKPIDRITLKGKKVLLVEDNKINQMVARRFLDEWGCITDIADNGAIALEKVRETNYDIVLMDLQMPVMDGYQASRKIREMKGKKYHTLPIVALSASAHGQLEIRALKYGMNGFVVKPFEPAYLFTIIDKHTNK